MHPLDDTIAAIASATGGAARGIVRLSGPAVDQCLEKCFRPAAKKLLFPLVSAQILAGDALLSSIDSPLPCELYLWPAGRSYTGQTVAEFHTFGSPPLLESLVKTLCAAGARPAEPGEFTLRAFLSGRIDLTQAEAVLGVIDAADPGQLQTALNQLAGGLAAPLHGLRGEILELLAELEAGFDFAEEDISFISSEELERRLAAIHERAIALREKMSARNFEETATKAALVGRPNAGKSSLFNSLLRKSGALVSARPGTTRDYLCAELNLDGVKCQLIDTAGIEATDLAEKAAMGDIASAAQSAARSQHRQSTIRILCLDAGQPPDDWERDQIEKRDPETTIVVITKIDDLTQDRWWPETNCPPCKPGLNGDESIYLTTSSVTGEGIEFLRENLKQKILSLGAAGEVVAGTAARCLESLRNAEESLHRGRTLFQQNAGEEFIAGELRLALEELGRVVGAVYTDDVLDRIFSRFCVGK